MNVPGSDNRRPEQTLYLVVGLIAIGVLYAVGFIIENSKHVTVDFVLFSTGTSLIVVILFTLILGLLGGIGLTFLFLRARARALRISTVKGRVTPYTVESGNTEPPKAG
ncbi:MAG: hypothetical protein QOI43_507 [Gaiellales bacterium]|nr:hypothetical protein [Gaiellales bacterium]